MSANIIGQILHTAANQAVTASGLAGIFDFANPRTYAIATAAGSIAGGVMDVAAKQVFNQDNTEGLVLTFLTGTITGLLVSAKVARLADNNFNYYKALGMQVLVLSGSFAASYMFGLVPQKN